MSIIRRDYLPERQRRPGLGADALAGVHLLALMS
jgi:hypothetical protein